jgi:cytochrome c-type biogenesis protein CcmH/NrfF
MSLWKASLAAVLLAASAIPAPADTEQVDGDAVRRVAGHIACKCGACKDTANCPMSMEGCGFCVPTRAKIARMQKAGFSDQAIMDTFIKEYGPDIYRAGPGNFFWLIPYGALFLGAGAILWFVSRYVGKPKQAVVSGPAIPDDPSYAHYRDAIEKEVGRLD